MPRRSAAGQITRHYDASRKPTPADRMILARLRREHRLPERGKSASSDRMLDLLAQVVDEGGATRYDADKLSDWLKRLPYRTEAEKIEDWTRWDRTRIALIADRVMIEGWSEARTAIEFDTTRQTVGAIVAAKKRAIRRSL